MFWSWVIEGPLLDAVEASGANRTPHAATVYLNQQFSAKYASHALRDYIRGVSAPQNHQQLQILEAASLNPYQYFPFGEFERLRLDKRTAPRGVIYWAMVCDKWAREQGITTQWEPNGYLRYLTEIDLRDDPHAKNGIQVPADIAKDITKRANQARSGWVVESKTPDLKVVPKTA